MRSTLVWNQGSTVSTTAAAARQGGSCIVLSWLYSLIFRTVRGLVIQSVIVGRLRWSSTCTIMSAAPRPSFSNHRRCIARTSVFGLIAGSSSSEILRLSILRRTTVSLFAFGTLRDDIPFVRLEYSQSYVGIYDAESTLGEKIVESCRIVELLFCQFMMQCEIDHDGILVLSNGRR